jgi:hypothetical protein
MRVLLAAAASLFCSLILVGCSLSPTASPGASQGSAIQGKVRGGRQPIAGSHVYLFAANTTGYGKSSISLLNSSSTGLSDSVGAYVASAADGSFTITGDYSCTPNTQVYIYALGGNPGAGINSAAGLLAALGNCPATGNFLSATPYINVNEVSTIATAYSFAGFATDATHVSSSGTPLAQIGIANAFANTANLETLSTGVALTTTPAGNGVAPQKTINTLADILAACVNSTGPASTGCTTLFSNTTSNGTATGTLPTDTASAAINLAHNPYISPSTLFLLYALELPAAPFLPIITGIPTDFTLGIQFSGGGLDNSSKDIAIDGSGSIWITNFSGSVTKLSNSGAVLSGTTGYTAGGFSSPMGIAIDTFGNAWIANSFSGTVTELSNSGTVLSGAGGYTGGGLNTPFAIAFDGSGNAWIVNVSDSLTKLSSSGVPISPSTGYTGAGLFHSENIAVDTSGNVWVTNNAGFGNSLISEFSSSGTPIAAIYGSTIYDPKDIAIDSSGNVWISNYEGIVELSSTGAFLSGSSGYNVGIANENAYLAIDGSGTVWSANGTLLQLSNSGTLLSGLHGYMGGSDTSPGYLIGGPVAVDSSGNVWGLGALGVTEVIGIASPVVTPLATGVANKTLGARP